MSRRQPKRIKTWFCAELPNYLIIAAMVKKLDANRPKKGGREGWQNDDPSALVRRVIEEAEELEHAVDTQPRGLILAEAADVANMALMVADAAGALDVCAVLGREVGNRGDSEGAVDVAERLIRERDEAVAALVSVEQTAARVADRSLEVFELRHEFRLVRLAARAVLAKHPEAKR